MLSQVLLLAQDGSIFNLRNGILLAVLIVILVGYKMYKNKQV